MINQSVLGAAYLFDWIAGDPEWLPHPVRLIGKGVEGGERILRRPGQRPAVELAVGGALTFSLVAAAYVGTARDDRMDEQARTRIGVCHGNIARVDLPRVTQFT